MIENYCNQCAESGTGNWDTPAQSGYLRVGVCVGCGWTCVNEAGNCVSPYCIKGHGAQGEGGLEETAVLFDGHSMSNVCWPVPLYKNGNFVPCQPEEVAVIRCVNENGLPTLPPWASVWAEQHGNTGWGRPESSGFVAGATYAVPRDWFDTWGRKGEGNNILAIPNANGSQWQEYT